MAPLTINAQTLDRYQFLSMMAVAGKDPVEFRDCDFTDVSLQALTVSAEVSFRSCTFSRVDFRDYDGPLTDFYFCTFIDCHKDKVPKWRSRAFCTIIPLEQIDPEILPINNGCKFCGEDTYFMRTTLMCRVHGPVGGF